MPSPDAGLLEDLALARRCAAREDAAWRDLLERHGPLIEGVMRRVFLRARLPDPSREAAEAMGALVGALLERDGALLRAYEPRAALRTYLAVVSRSVAIKLLRKRRPALSIGDPEESAVWEGRLSREDAAFSDLPVDREQLAAALDALAPRERLLLQMIYWEGMDYGKVARALEVQPGSVGPLVTRARASLKRLLSEAPAKKASSP